MSSFSIVAAPRAHRRVERVHRHPFAEGDRLIVANGELAHLSAQGRLRHSWDMEMIAGVDDDALAHAAAASPSPAAASASAASVDLILLPRAAHPKRRGQIERHLQRVRLTFPDAATARQAATAIRQAATAPRGGRSLAAGAPPSRSTMSSQALTETAAPAGAAAGAGAGAGAASGAISSSAASTPPSPPYEARRIFAVLNPHGGGGTAAVLFEQRVAPLLRWAGVEVELHRTQHAGHAVEFGQRYDPSRYDGVLFCTGDGGVQEFVSGLLTRPDWRLLVRRVPIAPIAGGTGECGVAGCVVLSVHVSTIAAIIQVFRCCACHCCRADSESACLVFKVGFLLPNVSSANCLFCQLSLLPTVSSACSQRAVCRPANRPA